MKYEDVKRHFTKAELFQMCIELDLHPSEIIKEYINSERDINIWNSAHAEYGKITNIERKDCKNDAYAIEVTWETNKPEGLQVKTTRSDIFNDDGETFDEWQQYLDQYCRMYVTYTENKACNSVYRVLLDIEHI